VSQALTVALDADSAPSTTFAELYRDCVGDLFAYVATLLQDRGAAEDVVAQAFERAYRKRRSFDRRRGSQRAWLFGIARNAALDELRRRRRTTALVAEPGEIAAHDDPDLLVRRVTVRDALNRMEPRDRELIALKFHGGLNNGEIAKLLGTSESNVGTRLHRAVSKLREACDA
jgi:RNA polymerase sigma-70 factor (ECF subfamily)